MRIGFDVSQTGQFKAGCGYFAESLARALIDAHAEHTYILYPTFGSGYWDPNWATGTLQLSGQGHVVRGLGHASFDELDGFWKHPPADLETRLGAPDVVHSNNFFCPPGLRKARLVFTVHDLAFATHPEWTTEANWQTCFNGVFEASLRADHVLAVSNYTRQEFLAMFPYFPEERVSVVYEASRFPGPTGSAAPPRLEQLARGQFWLSVGTAEPRKNLYRLLEAYARLKARGETSYPLVLAGGSGWMVDDLGARLESMHLSGDVLRLGYVDDASLQWLYENCIAFCYPSLLEGFGLPVIEAMSIGAAVLTSNVTSLPEVVGDAGVLVDPFDSEAIYAGMRLLAADDRLRSQLRSAALQRAVAFSWPAAATRVLDIYQRLLDERRPNNGQAHGTTEGKAVLGSRPADEQ